MATYLYGSSVQGIQKFIFDTNKLVEIVGASELVEQLSNNQFFEKFSLAENDLIMHAAGNIRLMTKNEEFLKKIVLEWPKAVAEKAPGLVLSQAVIQIDNQLNYAHFRELERRLMIARNKQPMNNFITPMAAIRSRRTGHAAIDWKDEDGAPRDLASRIKQKLGRNGAAQNLMSKCLGSHYEKFSNSFAADISDMVLEKEQNNWLAVIHADGNSLGKLIQSMVITLEENHRGNDLKNVFRDFSKFLDKSTIAATQYAIEKIVLDSSTKSNKLPFRPVIVGGDDLTFIIRADLALNFTVLYLRKFHEETEKNFKPLVDKYSLKQLEKGVTACAGIAYMKDSFPFHYAADLAEQLCAEAKKEAKKLDENAVPSAVLFHKISDSFVEDYSSIIKRELTTSNGEVKFKFGPYSVESGDKGLPPIDTLIEQVKLMLQKDSPKSSIRKWLTLLHQDKNKADLWLERIKEITTSDYIKDLKLNQALNEENKTHLYDVLTIASISRLENLMKGIA